MPANAGIQVRRDLSVDHQRRDVLDHPLAAFAKASAARDLRPVEALA